jgi:hypothetical protein
VAFWTGCGHGASEKDNRLVVTLVRTPGAVKKCLADRGLPATGGAAKPAREDTNAPDVGEVITAGAFIAFYSSARLADRRAREIAHNGTVSRHGRITVLYVSAPDFPAADKAQRKAIEACV